jgi:checkpoint serine/threonine-protein kinase
MKCILVTDISTNLPYALVHRSKKNKSVKTLKVKLEDGKKVMGNLKFNSERTLGEGGFGYVLKCSNFHLNLKKLGDVNLDLAAIKVGKDIGYLIWEVIVHFRIQLRLELLKDHSEIYRKHFLPPKALLIYDDASVMFLEYADLGSLLSMANIIYDKKNEFSIPEFEFLVIYIALQALKIINALHAAEIIHADIKTDNWVLKSYDTEELTLCLIDFGKTIDLKEIRYSIDSNKVGLIGSSAVEKFECPEMKINKPWTYQADYFGVCATIHNLHYGEDLNVTQETVEKARTRDIVIKESNDLFWVPRVVIKRYWDIFLWSEFYVRLLNWNSITEKFNLRYLINLFEIKSNSIHDSLKKVKYLSITFTLFFYIAIIYKLHILERAKKGQGYAQI